MFVSAGSAEARLVSWGSTQPETSILTVNGNLDAPQGTMPGSILTPMLRIDMVHANVEGDRGTDGITELVALRIQVTNTRAKDIASFAIARELSRQLGSSRSGFNPDPSLQANNSDALGRRIGDVNVVGAGISVYSPDEDPILAYVPMSQLLNDPDHPLDPYDENFSVFFNLVEPGSGREVFPAYAVRTNDFGFYETGPIEGDLYNLLFDIGGPGLTPPDGPLVATENSLRANTTTFYVLVEPSTSLENNTLIDVDLPAFGFFGSAFQPADFFCADPPERTGACFVDGSGIPDSYGFAEGDAIAPELLRNCTESVLFGVYGTFADTSYTSPTYGALFGFPDLIFRNPSPALVCTPIEAATTCVTCEETGTADEFNGDIQNVISVLDGPFCLPDDEALTFCTPCQDCLIEPDPVIITEMDLATGNNAETCVLTIEPGEEDEDGNTPADYTLSCTKCSQCSACTICTIDPSYFPSPFTQVPLAHIFNDRPRLIAVDMVADQVPLRKLNNVSAGVTGGAEMTIPNNGFQRSTRISDNRVWSEFPASALPDDNRVWSQWPPGYPPVSITARNPINASEYIVLPGRVHPDSGIVSGAIPSPEVSISGADLAWFGFDMAAGWPGGYAARIRELVVEVQGVGALREIPGDGADNDGDGLTDELGAEDVAQDHQVASRNDDFDFFTEILSPEAVRRATPETEISTALDGSPLSAEELILAVSVDDLYRLGQLDGPRVPGLEGFFLPGQQIPPDIRVRSGLQRGVYNRGWDPVFSVVHVLDDQNRTARFDEHPSKYYRDVVTPGYDPERRSMGLTDSLQPQLALRLEQLPAERAAYCASLMRIGALQSRLIDEDGDGELGSPEMLGFKIADFIDNATNPADPMSTNGLVDEGIDEEAQNSMDDDLDGLVDEDVHFVPALLAIDEEVNSFFVDSFGGDFGAPDPGIDFVYIDYDNDGIYDDGRDDHVTPNRDELVSRPASGNNPLRQGQSYYSGPVFPLDEDLDAEGEDGNPLTPAVAAYDEVDNDGNGIIDEGWNEDCRDVVFGELGNGRLPYGYISTSYLFEDSDDGGTAGGFADNAHFEAFTITPDGEVGTARIDQPVVPFLTGDSFLPPIQISLLSDPLFGTDPDRYFLRYRFGDRDTSGVVFPGVPGPEIPNFFDAKYDFFVGFQVPSLMPHGIDWQASIIGANVTFAHDFRTADIPNEGEPEFDDDALLFSLPEFTYPHVISATEFLEFGPSRFFDDISTRLARRYPSMAQLRDVTITAPARSTAYQITKRQFAHVEIQDMMGFTSPLEKDGGFRGRPYLEADGEPTPIFGINIADSLAGISERNSQITTLTVNFANVSLHPPAIFDPRVDLKPMSNQNYTDPDTGNVFSESGVALYRDNKSQGRPGEFDEEDIPIILANDSLDWRTRPSADGGGYFVTLRASGANLTIPDTDFDEIPGNTFNVQDTNRGYDYFVVIRTSDDIDARDSFRAYIRKGDIRLTNGFNVTGSESFSHPYTANVPTRLSRDSARPYDLEPDSGAQQIEVLPSSDSIPVLGIDMHDSNKTFDGNTPAKLATVSVLIGPESNRNLTLFLRAGATLAGATGPMTVTPGPCGGAVFLCSEAEATVRHEIELTGFLEADQYHATVWVRPQANHFFRFFHIRGNTTTLLAQTDPDNPEISTGTPLTGTPFALEVTYNGVPLSAIPGDRIVFEHSFTPFLGDGQTGESNACAIFNGCSTDSSGYSFIQLIGTNEDAAAPLKAKDSTYEKLLKIASDPSFPKDPAEIEKQAGGFNTNFLADLTNEIITNIPLDPAEDNDGDIRTFAIPDGLDNDGDGLTDEGLNDSFNFSPLRYTSLSGVAFFRDMPNSDTNGGFDDPLDPNVINPDLPVFLSGEENFDFPNGISALLVMALDHDPVGQIGPLSPGKGDPIDMEPFETIPADDLLTNAGDDYFVVIRTSRFLQLLSTFSVQLRVVFGSVNPAFPNDNLAVFAVPFGFMPGYTTGIGPVFPFRQPFLFDPLRNFRAIPSPSAGTSLAEEPLSPGSIHIPGETDPEDRTVPIETPFLLYESYKSATSLPLVGLTNGNAAPSLRWIEPTFPEVANAALSLVTGSMVLKWNDLDQDDEAGTSLVTIVYFPVEEDPMLGELLPRTPNDLKPNGEPFDFNVVSGVLGRLGLLDTFENQTIVPYENIPLAFDNEDVNPTTGLGNDVVTWDVRLITPGRYRVAAILRDGNDPPGGQNPRLIVLGGIVEISNERPSVQILTP